MITKIALLLIAASTAAFAQPNDKTITREFSWDGSEALIIDVPADVQFVQSTGVANVVVTGSRRSVEKFEVACGVLKTRSLRTGKRLKIVVTAPHITRFVAKGGDKLTIENFDQLELQIETTGRADVKASGRAETVKLNLQGFGWADLSQVQTQGADITLTGFRNAIVAPQAWAKLSGKGVVVLLTRPAQLTESLEGAGRIIHAGPPAESKTAIRQSKMPQPLALSSGRVMR
jgi:hypothetical protein